jgi:hypothetical protein
MSLQKRGFEHPRPAMSVSLHLIEGGIQSQRRLAARGSLEWTPFQSCDSLPASSSRERAHTTHVYPLHVSWFRPRVVSGGQRVNTLVGRRSPGLWCARDEAAGGWTGGCRGLKRNKAPLLQVAQDATVGSLGIGQTGPAKREPRPGFHRAVCQDLEHHQVNVNPGRGRSPKGQK